MSTQVKIDGNSIKVLVIKFTLRVLFFNRVIVKDFLAKALFTVLFCNCSGKNF